MDRPQSLPEVLPRMAPTSGARDRVPALRSRLREVGKLRSSGKTAADALIRLREIHEEFMDRHIDVFDPKVQAMTRDPNALAMWNDLMNVHTAIRDFLAALDQR